jgi:hypothetical protein
MKEMTLLLRKERMYVFFTPAMLGGDAWLISSDYDTVLTNYISIA